MPLRLAGNEAAVRRVHVHLRGNQHGWFTVHAYRFDEDTSTWIVEMPRGDMACARPGSADTRETIAFCEGLFAPYLQAATADGEQRAPARARLDQFPLASATRTGRSATSCCSATPRIPRIFPSVPARNSRWKMRLDLQRALCEERSMNGALARYESERRIEVLRLQNAARNTTEWFENVAAVRTIAARAVRVQPADAQPADQSTKTCACAMTLYVERIERWLSARKSRTGPADVHAVSFAQPRIAQPRRCLAHGHVRAVDGMPNDFHLVHLGGARMGGAGLVYTEMTCVSPEGRITPGCAGMYKPEHAPAGSASSISCTSGPMRKSACNSGKRTKRLDADWCGREWTSRCPTATGR